MEVRLLRAGTGSGVRHSTLGSDGVARTATQHCGYFAKRFFSEKIGSFCFSKTTKKRGSNGENKKNSVNFFPQITNLDTFLTMNSKKKKKR